MLKSVHFLTINLVYLNLYPYLCITELVTNPTGGPTKVV